MSQSSGEDPSAASQLLPLVYDELRKLAAARLAREKPGHSLQATALVHEAYLRLTSHENSRTATNWDSRGHFFASAAHAMRQVLVDMARRKKRDKRGGGMVQSDVPLEWIEALEPPENLLELDAALEKLARVDGTAAELVHLRYFAGLTLGDAASILNIPRRTADRRWAYARAWLHQELGGVGSELV